MPKPYFEARRRPAKNRCRIDGVASRANECFLLGRADDDSVALLGSPWRDPSPFSH